MGKRRPTEEEQLALFEARWTHAKTLAAVDQAHRARRARGRPTNAARRLLERGRAVRWHTAEDNRALRAALRHFLGELDGFVQQRIAAPVQLQGATFYGHIASRDLFHFLLTAEALDVIGIGDRFRRLEYEKLAEARRRPRMNSPR